MWSIIAAEMVPLPSADPISDIDIPKVTPLANFTAGNPLARGRSDALAAR